MRSFRVSTCRPDTSKAGSTKDKVWIFVFIFVLVSKSPSNVKYFTASIGGKGLGSFRNLETLDLGVNFYDSSVFPYLNEAVSLKTLILRDNLFKGGFPVQGSTPEQINTIDVIDIESLFTLFLVFLTFGTELRNLTSLEVLDLKFNEFSGQLPTQGICYYDPPLTLCDKIDVML